MGLFGFKKKVDAGPSFDVEEYKAEGRKLAEYAIDGRWSYLIDYSYPSSYTGDYDYKEKIVVIGNEFCRTYFKSLFERIECDTIVNYIWLEFYDANIKLFFGTGAKYLLSYIVNYLNKAIKIDAEVRFTGPMIKNVFQYLVDMVCVEADIDEAKRNEDEDYYYLCYTGYSPREILDPSLKLPIQKVLFDPMLPGFDSKTIDFLLRVYRAYTAKGERNRLAKNFNKGFVEKLLGVKVGSVLKDYEIDKLIDLIMFGANGWIRSNVSEIENMFFDLLDGDDIFIKEKVFVVA